MELWPVSVMYLQSSGDVGVYHICIKPSDFAKTIPALLKYIAEEKGKVIRYVVEAPKQYIA